jgi:hypothetical protein
MKAFSFPAGEYGALLRSRLAQRLNVQNDVRLAVSLAAALQNAMLTSRYRVETTREVAR